MTETLEGVRDPHHVDPDAENAVAVFAMHPPGFDDLICDVDADGVVRRPESGKPVPWASYSVEATDVDPETWGDHYHHPDDCPETRRCDDCTVAADREHDREHYRTEVPDDFDAEAFREDLEAALDALPDDDHRGMTTLMVPEGMADALEAEAETEVADRD